MYFFLPLWGNSDKRDLMDEPTDFPELFRTRKLGKKAEVVMGNRVLSLASLQPH